MTDQCMHCTVRGDIDACMKTPCSQHESWYAQTLKALAKQEQGEPVAEYIGNNPDELDLSKRIGLIHRLKFIPLRSKLYTTPQQRTWVGLTLDERMELAQDVDWAAGAYCEYAEVVEAKLKEKNT